MKTRIHLITGFTMFVLCISICTKTANATVIWSDDFDNGILDGWTLFGYESINSPVKIDGNFSAESFMLTVLDDDVNCARNDSTVNVGTWSYDMFVPDDGYGFIRVEFMSNGSSLSVLGNQSWSAVSAWLYGPEEDRGFYLLQGLGSGKVPLRHITDIPLQGWHHIDVSRTSDGHFYVWFNGTLKASVASPSVTNSMYLQVLCDNVSGAAIDNLVIDDVPWTPTTPTTTTPTTPTTTTPTTPPPPPPIDPTLLVMIGGTAVVVIVLAIVFLRRR